MKKVLKKISDVMKKIFGWGILISLAVSVLMFGAYIAALIVGGEDAVRITAFIKDEVTPILIYATSCLVLFALLAMYLGGEWALSSKNSKKGKRDEVPSFEPAPARKIGLMRKFQLFIKRAFDIVVSLTLIIVFTVIPVFIIVPILIKATSKGPVVFKQDRVGKDGKVFKIYKFRTMRIPEDSLDENGEQLPPKKRITKVGKFLRKTSLDELMQLFNVLGGSMSIIGPRPTLPYQVERYNDEQKRRHEMRPGVTGWAQVNGRNDLSWTEKIVYDVEYIDKFSLLMDIKILFKTVGVVFRRDGIEFNREDAITAKTPAVQETVTVGAPSEETNEN